MRTILAALLGIHGLIHLIGPVKAFGLAEVPQLTQPISRTAGLVWLVAGALFVASGVSLLVAPRVWWMIAGVAILLSQGAIVASWTDARFGTVLNVVALVGVVLAFLMTGPTSLRAQYDRNVASGLARLGQPAPVTEDDLRPLPPPVQQYLRMSGVVGQPRVQNLYARMHGRIRSGADAPWMPFTAEQHNFFDEPARLFYMDAQRSIMPIQVFHRYVGSGATMRVKVAGAVTVADAAGMEMTQAETVTLFNDMCMLAPATLISPSIAWEVVDARTVRARFTNAGHAIRAELLFDASGALVNFWSDDRRQASADGTTMRAVRWSTPFGAARAFGPLRLSGSGEARWHESGGDYAYIEITLDDVRYNVTR